MSSVSLGFTLLELVVVLAIAGLVGTFAISGISNATLAARESEAIARVEQTLVAARSWALRTNRCIVVEIVNAKTMQVREHNDSSLPECNSPAFGLAPRQIVLPGNAAQLSPTIEGTDGGALLVFLPDGGTPYPGPAIVTVTTRIRQVSIEIEVLPQLGRVARRLP